MIKYGKNVSVSIRFNKVQLSLAAIEKKGSVFGVNILNIPADSERRETIEALIPLLGVRNRVLAYFPFTGVRTISCA